MAASTNREPHGPTALGQRIKRCREERKLTQDQLAQKAGCTKGAVSQWENGDVKNLRLDRLFKVADALDVVPRWLAIGSGPRWRHEVKGDAQLTKDELKLLELYRQVPPGHRLALHNFLQLSPTQRDEFSENVLYETFGKVAADTKIGPNLKR